jgi:hypothetical protein
VYGPELRPLQRGRRVFQVERRLAVAATSDNCPQQRRQIFQRASLFEKHRHETSILSEELVRYHQPTLTASNPVRRSEGAEHRYFFRTMDWA